MNDNTYASNNGELVLLSTRQHMGRETAEKISLLFKTELDWKKIVSIAKRNKVVHLVDKTMTEHFDGMVDSEDLQALTDESQVHFKSNEDSLDLLLDIKTLLLSESIPVIFFKGIIFAHVYNKDYKFRTQGDIDILVRPEDFLKARDILVRNGFESVYFGHAEVSTVQAQLGRSDRRASVDLHYGVTPQYQQTNMDEALSGSKFDKKYRNKIVKNRTYWFCQFQTEEIWKRKIQIEIEGETITTLSHEDTLLVAVIHAAKENWRSMSRISDITAIIETSGNLNWEIIYETVSGLGFLKKFYLGIRLANEMYDVELPVNVIRMMNKHGSKYLARQIIFRLTLDNFTVDMEEFRRIVAIMTMDSITDFFRYLQYVFNTPAGPTGKEITQGNFLGFLKVLSGQYIRKFLSR